MRQIWWEWYDGSLWCGWKTEKETHTGYIENIFCSMWWPSSSNPADVLSFPILSISSTRFFPILPPDCRVSDLWLYRQGNSTCCNICAKMFPFEVSYASIWNLAVSSLSSKPNKSSASAISFLWILFKAMHHMWCIAWCMCVHTQLIAAVQLRHKDMMIFTSWDQHCTKLNMSYSHWYTCCWWWLNWSLWSPLWSKKSPPVKKKRVGTCSPCYNTTIHTTL